jgi:uncharacterized protein YyaL (SSP411 family)
MIMSRVLALALLLLSAPLFAASDSKPGGIKWEPWSDAVFERAAREKRFVLLDLEAVWCHWCHVMEEKTYSNPKVIELIKAKYIAVRVDQDSRPDISRRYENYGWPATVVFNVEGGKVIEVMKRRGFIEPQVMVSILQEIIVDPSPIKYGDSEPVTKFADNPLLPQKTRAAFEKAYYETQDTKLGGLAQFQKFIERESMDYGLYRAMQGDAKAKAAVRLTLTNALKLMDPAWGGMYQYSTDGDWEHPHFEKIMAMQAEPMRQYALAYGEFRDPKYLQAVRDIHRYVTTFFKSPEGAYYTSQDADLIPGQHSEAFFALNDAQRRKQGIPRVDKHRYARENGWLINALAVAYGITGEAQYLKDAEAAARWVMANRSLPNGGFRHDEKDSGGPFLEDTSAMGQAFLALYTATGSREWLKQAESSAAFIEQNFKVKDPGYLTSSTKTSSKLPPSRTVDENMVLARYTNLLRRYTGAAKYRQMTDHALRFLVADQVLEARLTAPGILLAAFEAANEPLHVTVVGRKDDPQALKLFKAANAHAATYRRLEWWDKREGKMPNPDVQYPELPKAAAFICTDSTCSLPIFEAEKIAKEIARTKPAAKAPAKDKVAKN